MNQEQMDRLNALLAEHGRCPQCEAAGRKVEEWVVVRVRPEGIGARAMSAVIACKRCREDEVRKVEQSVLETRNKEEAMRHEKLAQLRDLKAAGWV